MKKDIRFVVVRGVRYLRVDDVADYIRELGGSEETNVRNRLEQATTELVKERQ